MHEAIEESKGRRREAKRIDKKRKGDDVRFAIIRQLPVMMQAMSSSSWRGGGEMEMEGLFGRKGEKQAIKGHQVTLENLNLINSLVKTNIDILFYS